MLLRRYLMMAQQSNGLPSEYKKLEYIKNGTENYCLIPTTLYYKKPEDSIEIMCLFEDNNNVRMCGVGEYRQIGYLSMGREGTKFWGYFSSRSIYDWNSYNIPNQTIYTISALGNSIYANDDLVFTQSQMGKKYQVKLFGLVNPKSDPITGVLRIYSCKLTIDGVEHLLIPAQRKADGEYGLFNTTTQEFYINTGEGTLTGV